MKKIIIPITVVAAVVFGFIIFRHRDAVVSVTPTPSAMAQSGYRLIVITDEVTLKHPSDAKAQTVHGEVSISAGDQVTTLATGRARLSWPNGTITTLESDSQVTIKDLSDDGAKSRIELIFGDIWSKVTKVLGGGQYYEVQTQDTVAAVRGTIFRTTYRNKRSRIQGIEHIVRVALRKSDGTADESTATDVGEQMEVEQDASTPTPRGRLESRRLNQIELREKIYEYITRERDLRDGDILHSTSTPKPTLSPSVTPLPSVSVTPRLTSIPTPSQTPTPSATPVATPTPSTSVMLDHVFPDIINFGDTFSVEGSNFLSGRSISQIASVTVGGKPASFSVVGATSLFVTPGQLSAGTYDVGVVSVDGTALTLKNAITIK